MKFIAVAVAALGILSAAGPAVAQQPGPDAPYTEYTFRDDLVAGQLLRPGGDALFAARRAPTISLIVIRSTFVPELLKSGEAL